MLRETMEWAKKPVDSPLTIIEFFRQLVGSWDWDESGNLVMKTLKFFSGIFYKNI
jgi:hypothetical protein